MQSWMGASRLRGGASVEVMRPDDMRMRKVICRPQLLLCNLTWLGVDDIDIGAISTDDLDGVGTGEPSGVSEDEARAAILSLEPGGWVEFLCDGRSTRARLTRIGEHSGRYLFLDRRGLKVADSSGEALVAEVREGRMRVIDEAPLIERTMNSVAGDLRGALDT